MNIGRFRECLRMGVAPGHMHWACRLNKKDSDAPDYTPMAQASEEAARIGAELGREQLAESRRQYEENRAAIAPILAAQKGIMDSTKQQGDDYYQYQTNTFRPLEQKIVADAMNFDTEGYREGQARSASLDVQRAMANSEAQSARAMAAMGVNPNSGRFAGMKRANSLQTAAMRAGAATGARTQAEAMGYARKMDAAGLGRNLPGASTGAYQVAVGAGNSAAGNQMAPGAQLLNGMAQGSGTIMQGQAQHIQGLSGILGSQTSMASQGDGGATAATIGAAGGIAVAI